LHDCLPIRAAGGAYSLKVRQLPLLLLQLPDSIYRRGPFEAESTRLDDATMGTAHYKTEVAGWLLSRLSMKRTALGTTYCASIGLTQNRLNSGIGLFLPPCYGERSQDSHQWSLIVARSSATETARASRCNAITYDTRAKCRSDRNQWHHQDGEDDAGSSHTSNKD
jgi:hypothetical protein